VRNRRGLNKIWVLALALLVAMGAVGVTYGAWTDEIYVAGTLSTSGVNTVLKCGSCTINPDDPTGITGISCLEDGQLTLEITVTNAQFSDVPQINTHYLCNFTIDNTAAGSLPVKIQSITITDYDGVTEDIGPAGLLTGTYQIDPGGTAAGTVDIHLTTGEQVGEDLVFTLTATVKRWNE